MGPTDVEEGRQFLDDNDDTHQGADDVAERIAPRSFCWVERAFHRGDSLVLRSRSLVCGCGPRWCSVGPHWPLLSVTFGILSVFAIFTIHVVWSNDQQVSSSEAWGGLCLCGGSLLAYALTACTDPGVVPVSLEPTLATDTYCDYCASYRPAGASHCSDCKVCVLEYDHHCPWTGKCIGKRNLTYFYLWLFSLVFSFVYEMIQLTTYLLPPPQHPPHP
ncbi:transmembrane protein [Achlya hypogyna]|uniref:Palmitoyltransferase n=1 Tax=Achlya hypogyna TaxID=1202772 RepID=A0A1V9YP11_ACHHY|nr:transmembrane protein [Achlya hypogyna]